jgi:hypothetical protein
MKADYFKELIMNYQKLLVIFFTIIISLTSQMAFAASLQQAKSEGWIGEQNNGYVGFVSPNPNDEIKSLVSEVNSKRRTVYAKLATKQNISLGQVELLAGSRNAEKTVSGNYYQDDNGNWIKKK